MSVLLIRRRTFEQRGTCPVRCLCQAALAAARWRRSRRFCVPLRNGIVQGSEDHVEEEKNVQE